MPDGSFYQSVPVTVTKVFQPGTRITLSGRKGEQIYYYGQDFGGNFSVSGSYSGDVVFAGLGISDPGHSWDDLKDLDIRGKIVVILDALRPGQKYATGPYYYYRLNPIISALRDRGASAVLSVVSTEREEKFNSGFNIFDDIPTGRLGIIYDSQKTTFESESQKKPEREALFAV